MATLGYRPGWGPEYCCLTNADYVALFHDGIYKHSRKHWDIFKNKNGELRMENGKRDRSNLRRLIIHYLFSILHSGPCHSTICREFIRPPARRSPVKEIHRRPLNLENGALTDLFRLQRTFAAGALRSDSDHNPNFRVAAISSTRRPVPG